MKIKEEEMTNVKGILVKGGLYKAVSEDRLMNFTLNEGTNSQATSK